MSKVIASFVALAFVVPFMASAASCTDPGVSCANGNPENVQNYGGFVNAQLPKVAPGKYAADGKSLCPIFFTSPCVDITATPYYHSIFR